MHGRWIGFNACAAMTLLAFAAMPHSRTHWPARSDLSVSGVVWDSLGDVPLAGADVQFVGPVGDAAPRLHEARADSTGRYRFEALPEGRYAAGFFHPLLDSLGLEIREVHVSLRGATSHVDLGTPSPATLASRLCGRSSVAQPGFDSGSIVIGHVRDAVDEEPVARAEVQFAWPEASGRGAEARLRQVVATATTSESGWFGVCGIPEETPLLARAARAPDSSGIVRLAIPSSGFLYVRLLIGAARPRRVQQEEASVAPEIAAAAPALFGTASLEGVVGDGAGNRLAGARVEVLGTGRSAASRVDGTFRLDSLPSGSYTLQLRALGYGPVERLVNLVAGSVNRVALVLRERTTVLPTVRVNAEAVANARRLELAGFSRRKADAAKGFRDGYFFTAEDIEKQHTPYVTRLMFGLSGIHVSARGKPLDDVILGPNNCKMTVYLDGVRIVNALGNMPDIPVNQVVSPFSVAGIEVYPRAVTSPPEYQMLNGTCGVVLIWTK